MTKTFTRLQQSAVCMVYLVLLSAVHSPATLCQVFEPDDETCLMCHEEYDKGLAKTVHRLSSEVENATFRIGCVSCHEGGEVHADDPSVENITNPTKTTSAAVNSTCTRCHQPHTEMDNVGFDPHIGEDLACTSCHSIHNGVTALLMDEEAQFCGKCHMSAVNAFKKRSNHPLIDGNLTCLSCHNFTGRGNPDYGYGGNANCYRCHPEQSGPYMYEHEASSSFTTEGGGCVACHFPHGSPNERLLNQPNNSLCRQCHGLPPFHATAHNGEGASFGCLECHSEVHGSYDNSHLLDPQLGIKIGGSPGSCLCHDVSD